MLRPILISETVLCVSLETIEIGNMLVFTAQAQQAEGEDELHSGILSGPRRRVGKKSKCQKKLLVFLSPFFVLTPPAAGFGDIVEAAPQRPGAFIKKNTGRALSRGRTGVLM